MVTALMRLPLPTRIYQTISGLKTKIGNASDSMSGRAIAASAGS